MNEKFVHLHVRSHYSIGHGLIRIPALCRRVARLGMPAVALTDFCNTAGLDEFRREAAVAGITPIYGMEIPVVFDTPRSGASGRERVVVLVENTTGWRNLLALAAMFCVDGELERTGLAFSRLKIHADGLIILADCRTGSIGHRLWRGDRRGALAIARLWREMAGPDGFFFELVGWQRPADLEFHAAIDTLAQEAGIRTVATGDVRYLSRRDLEYWRLVHGAEGETEGIAAAWLQGRKRMQQLFRLTPGAVGETAVIAARCTDWEHAVPPAAADGADDGITISDGKMDFYSGFLRSACLAGLARLRPVVDPKYQARLDRELSAVSGTGAMDFFLLANDLTAFLRDSGLPRAHCPGKASASLVLYALGLTRLDPLDMGIRFRHFHSGRAWPPPPLAFEVESRHMPAVASWLARRSGPPWALRILEMPSGSGGSSFLTLRRLLRSDGFLEEECEILEHALVIGRTGHLHAEFLELEAYGFTPDRLDRLRSLIRVADGLVTGWADCTRFLLRYVLCHGPASPLLPCRPATPVPGIRVGTTWQRLAETGVAVFDLRARN